MASQKIPGRVSRCQRRSGTGGTGLLLALLSVLLVSLSGCGLSDGGSSGKHIGAWQAIQMLDTQHGWASTYLAILRTSDGGAHWQDVTPWQKRSPWGHSATFLTPQIAWVVQQGNKDDKTPAQVFRTADGGETWQHADLPDSVSTFTPTSSPYQGNRSDVAVSNVSAIDAQHAWVLSTRTYTPSHDPDNIQITYTHVLQTSDGGATWSVLVSRLPGLPSEQNSTSPSVPGINWAALVNSTTGWLNGPTPETLLVTQDDGQTWHQRTLPALLRATAVASESVTQLSAPILLSAHDAILPAVTYGRAGNNAYYFYVTRDGGATWTVTPALTLLGFPEADYLDVTHWSLLTESAVLYQTADGGQHWTTSHPKTDFRRILDVHFLTNSTGWAIGDNTPANGPFMGDSDTVTSPIKTSDGGKTWKTVTYTVE